MKGSEVAQPAFGTRRLGEVEDSLPEDLRLQFRSLVEDCHFHARKRGWHPIRQYEVLADLLRAGWRGPDCSEGARAR